MPYKKRAGKQPALGFSKRTLSPILVIVLVLVDIMDVDTDTPVGAAANPLAHVRSVTARTDHCNRRRLRNEDEVALGVRRHRVRAGRLRDGLDQDAGPVDHAEHGRLRVSNPPVCQSCWRPVVAPVALVEPDLIRADDAVDAGVLLVFALMTSVVVLAGLLPGCSPATDCHAARRWRRWVRSQ